MSEKITFSYFYGQEVNIFSFYRIPKFLFSNDLFQDLSTDAKVLYGLMLDRISLSIKNEWFDGQNRAFIYFTIEETMEMLNCKKNKAIDTMKALEDLGLIERIRRGQGKTTIIYVKSFTEEFDEHSQKLEKQTSDTEKKGLEVGKSHLLKLENQTSKGWKNKPLEVGKNNSNNIKDNNTDINNTNHIRSDGASIGDSEYQVYSELIRENIELDNLYERYPFDQEILEGIYDLILEMVLTTRGTVHIAKNEYPVQLVKSKFLKLNSSHVEYVIESLKSSTSKVRNIKKYMLASLFNAPTTMSSYIQAEVNHDMLQYACAK